jgi:hypothetical protein
MRFASCEASYLEQEDPPKCGCNHEMEVHDWEKEDGPHPCGDVDHQGNPCECKDYEPGSFDDWFED